MGRALGKGACLSYSGNSVMLLRELTAEQRPDLNLDAPLDLVLGAQIGEFSGQSLFDAFNSAWSLDSRADRMGIRLLGTALQYQGKPMISEGIPLGAVQVPPDGQPIVLLNDRQTIGGYPRLGALTPLALARLAQCLPGAQVRLRPVVQEVAHRRASRVFAPICPTLIVPKLCGQCRSGTLRISVTRSVTVMHSHAERRNDRRSTWKETASLLPAPEGSADTSGPQSNPARYWSTRYIPRYPSDTG